MNYLAVEKLSKNFPEHQLFDDLTFGLDRGDKVALIANNGAGKSTLIRILLGTDVPDSGTVKFKDGIRVGILEQDPTFNPTLTVNQLIDEVHAEVKEAIQHYEKVLEKQSAQSTPEDLEALEKATSKMDLLHAWDYDRALKIYLSRFGIHDREAIVGDLSGGQRKRLALAITLSNNPDFLILDEPTNHLDIEMIEWLEKYLDQSNLTLFMVTHDRYFLDTVCNQILELHNGNLYRHKGNYAYFLEKRAEREAVFDREIEKANSMLKRELEWMRRMPQARTTKAKSRIDAFYALEDKACNKRIDPKLTLDVKVTRIGGKILEMKQVSKSYGDLNILKKFTYTFKKGDRVGIVGKNGVGKSTFLNLLTGSEEPDSGKINRGETVVFGYYTQKGIQVASEKRVIDVVKDIAEYLTLSNGVKLSASQFLEHFMFPPETQYKPVHKLSGGEQRRLYLLTVLIKNPNFLILDEPTNDLDLLTLNKLEAFLMNYSGCLILVSHDRYFMDKLVDHLFIFEGDGQIKDYNSTYTEYRLQQADTNVEEKPASKVSTPVKPVQNQSTERRYTNKEKNEFRKLEREIEQLEKDVKQLESSLNEAGISMEKINEISQTIGQHMQEIEEKTERWMELSELFE